MKNKVWKKLAALGLTAAMLCGCGAKAPAADSQTASEEVLGTEVGTQEEAEASRYPEYLNLDSFRPIVKDGEEITLKVVTNRESIAKSDINENFFPKFIEEKLNINLDIEELSGDDVIDERKNLMFASDDLPDIMLNMHISSSDVVNYGVEGGQLLPISDYFSEELTPNILAMLEENEQIRQENTAPDGKMYTLSRVMANYPGSDNSMGLQRVFINTKYMEAAGIEKVPETLDEFVEMLRAFKSLDPASMGVDEIWPMVSTWGCDKELLMNAFGWMIGTSGDPTAIVWDAGENEVVVPCSQEKYGDYVKLLHTLYSEGLIHPDFYTIDKTAARALYTEGAVPVLADAAPYLSLPDTYEDFVAATPLSSQWCEKGLTVQNNPSMGAMFISADTEYPEVCVRLLDYLFSEEGSVYSTVGAPENSEDLMGINGGFTISENGSPVYKDVTDGKYESDFDYTVNAVALSHGNGLPYDENKKTLGLQKMCGVEEPQFRELDLTNPDDHYRKLVYEAHQGHMTSGLPTMYMDTETAARYSDLKTVIKNYVDAESAKFVVGQRSLDELPAFFEELKDLGIDEYVEIAKNAYANYERPQE